MTCNLPIYIKRESQFVGIGTNQPGAALHVQGDIILAGQMFNAEGEPFSLGGGGGGSWKSRTSNLPLLVAPGDGSGAVIQVLSNVCLQKYGGNDNAYNIYTKALVVNAPTNREADYRISLPDMIKSNVYAPDTVIGEFWLTTTSNNESMTYKAVASVRAAEYDFATVRFLSGTTSVSFGHIGAGNVIELNGIMAFATKISINSPPSDSIYIPAASVQWMEVAYPNPNVFGVGTDDFLIAARKGMVRYFGDDIAYRIDVSGLVQNSAALTNNYTLTLPYPIQLGSYSENAIVGDLAIRITNSFSTATTTIYRAYARVLAHTDSAVELRYINGTHDSSLYDIDVGSTIMLQGTLEYKTTMTASVAIPYSYIPNSLTQDTQGNIGIGTSLTPAKLTVGGDINFTGSLYQNGVAFVSSGGDVSVTGNVLPSACNVYNLGSADSRWKDLYLSGNTIDLGGTFLKRDEESGGIKIQSESGQAVDTNVRNLNASGYVDINGTRLARHVTGPLMVQTAAGEMESGMFKHVYVDGTVRASNLEIIGEYVTLNTVTSNTEQVVVENAGTGPALKVTQTGANSIAEFYDDGGVLALKIADGGNVGIGTALPLQKLHVVGAIKATTSINSDTQFLGQASDSASAPSFSFIDDTNTGIFRPTADNVGISCGGVERMRVLSNGNVGIGTGVPMAKLDVLGNINADSISSIAYIGTKNFTFNPTNSLGRYFIGKITGGSLIKLFIYDDGWGHGCGAEVTININWGSTNTNLPNVTMSAGTQQNYAFYFQGTVLSGVGYLWFNESQSSNNNNIAYNIKIFANGLVDLNTNDGLTGSSSALLNSGLFHVNGNVGIGTTQPQATLHVNGIIRQTKVPCFYAYRNSAPYSQSTVGQIPLDLIQVNVNACYNTSTSTFVAPISGIYKFTIAAIHRFSSAVGYGELAVYKKPSGGSTFTSANNRALTYSYVTGSGDHDYAYGSIILNVNALDEFRMHVNGLAAGTDFYIGEGFGYFEGYLIG